MYPHLSSDPNVKAILGVLPVTAFGGRRNPDSDVTYEYSIWNEKDNYCFSASALPFSESGITNPEFELNDEVWACAKNETDHTKEIYMGAIEKISAGYDEMLRHIVKRPTDGRWHLWNVSGAFSTREPEDGPALTLDISFESVTRKQFTCSQIFEQKKYIHLIVRKQGSKR
jgi:hypothetical protein